MTGFFFFMCLQDHGPSLLPALCIQRQHLYPYIPSKSPSICTLLGQLQNISLLPAICSVTVKFSEPTFLTVRSRNFLTHSDSLVPIFLKTFLLFKHSLHGVLSIHLENDIAVASSHLHLKDVPQKLIFTF